MSWNPPGEHGTALPPPPPSAPTTEWTWPPTPHPTAPAPARGDGRVTGRGVLAMVLGFGTALAVLVRTFVDIGQVPAIIGTGAPIARGSGRFLFVAVVLVVAAVLAVVRDDMTGLVGGLAAGSIGLLASWMQLGRDDFAASTLVGAFAVGGASLAFAIGAVWATGAPPLPTGVRAMGLVVSALVLLGGLLPLRSGTAFTDLTLPVLLMATFAAGHRHSLYGAIGLAVSRLEFPLYYLVVSPRRNPFDVLHPVLFLGLVMVLLTAVVGLAGTAAGTTRRATR